MPSNISTSGEMIRDLQLSLGYPTIDIELDDQQYALAVNRALSFYQRWAVGNATKRDNIIMSAASGVSAYQMPNDVLSMVDSYLGADTLAGNANELFTFENILWNTGVLNVWNWGYFGLVSYELSLQYLNMLQQMIPSKYVVQFHRSNKTLTITPTPTKNDILFLSIHRAMPTSGLYDAEWVFDWAKAECMEILGRIRGKYTSLPGPGGNVTLDGRELTQQALNDKERLREALLRAESEPLEMIIG